MAVLYTLSVFLHIVAAAFWVGGMLFLSLVVVPALRGEPERARIIERVGIFFERAGMGALVVVLLTGLVNLGFRGVTSVGALWSTPAGRMGVLKLLLFALVAGLSLWHNRLIGRKAVQLLRHAQNSAEGERLRRWSSWVGRIVLLISLALVLLGVFIARGVSLW